MLIVAGEIVVAEGAVEQVRDALNSMETETRKEAGCRAYAFSVDVNDPKMVRIFERWENMEALEAHMQTPHMAEFGLAVGKIAPQSVDVKVYEVSREVDLPR